MKMYLTSVSSCVDQIESFKNLINRDTRLVVLPFSYHKDYINCAEDIYNHFDREVSNKESIYWRTVKPFIDAGIDSDKITIINQFTDSPLYIKQKITKPNTIVYLPGGYPENIVENIYKYDLQKCINCCEVIVGESAGSMAPFNEFFVYKDQDYPSYKRYKGLNMISGMTILPHFDPRNKDIIRACEKFAKQRPKVKAYCIMDGGYVLLDNKKLVEYEKTYVFKKRRGKFSKYFKGFFNFVNMIH